MQTPKADISDSSEKLVSPTARLMRGWFPLTVNPRDCVLQPRVARNELPWEIVQTASQPQRGCGRARHPRTQFRWGWLALARRTQGSSFLATLGFVAQSLRDCGALGFKSRRKTRPTAALLIPHIALVPLDLVLAKQGPQLILKTGFLVMLLLFGDVPDDLLQIRMANSQIGITALPLEIEMAAALFFEPKVGDPFEFFHPFRLSNRAPKASEHMNVIFNPAHLQRRALELFGHRAKVRVQGLPNGLIA